MKFVGPDGVQLGEMERLARTRTNLAGMQHWCYITVTPGRNDRDGKRPGPDAVVRATEGGRMAQEVWGPLFGVVDDRWRERFGDNAIADLRTALSAIVDCVDLDLPDCMPILGYGLFSSGRNGAATFLHATTKAPVRTTTRAFRCRLCYRACSSPSPSTSNRAQGSRWL